MGDDSGDACTLPRRGTRRQKVTLVASRKAILAMSMRFRRGAASTESSFRHLYAAPRGYLRLRKAVPQRASRRQRAALETFVRHRVFFVPPEGFLAIPTHLPYIGFCAVGGRFWRRPHGTAESITPPDGYFSGVAVPGRDSSH